MFERWNCWWNRTWAFRIFKKHHIQLNDLYWVNRSASNLAFRTIRNINPTDPASNVFSLSPSDISRINFNIGKWTTDYKEFMNWVRLSAAVSLCSYLEIYLQNVIILALESDPAILLGVSQAIDGVKLLKTRSKYSYLDYTVPIVKGTWGERINKYREYFGSVPTLLENSLNNLERLRQLRNGVGHTFGREVETYNSRIHVSMLILNHFSDCQKGV